MYAEFDAFVRTLLALSPCLFAGEPSHALRPSLFPNCGLLVIPEIDYKIVLSDSNFNSWKLGVVVPQMGKMVRSSRLKLAPLTSLAMAS